MKLRAPVQVIVTSFWEKRGKKRLVVHFQEKEESWESYTVETGPHEGCTILGKK